MRHGFRRFAIAALLGAVFAPAAWSEDPAPGGWAPGPVGPPARAQILVEGEFASRLAPELQALATFGGRLVATSAGRRAVLELPSADADRVAILPAYRGRFDRPLDFGPPGADRESPELPARFDGDRFPPPSFLRQKAVAKESGEECGTGQERGRKRPRPCPVGPIAEPVTSELILRVLGADVPPKGATVFPARDRSYPILMRYDAKDESGALLVLGLPGAPTREDLLALGLAGPDALLGRSATINRRVHPLGITCNRGCQPPGEPAGPVDWDPSAGDCPCQWGHASVRIREAWDRGISGQDVLVAVVDTGVDVVPWAQGGAGPHPDLVGRIAENGVNFVEGGAAGSPDWSDPAGHGTHIAGIIAANADGRGIEGVAPLARILPVRALPDEFEGDNFTSLILGLNYAIDAGAKVINCSWGIFAPDPELEAAVRRAQAMGAVIVAAAGNIGGDCRPGTAVYPAWFASGAYDAPADAEPIRNVIAVGGVECGVGTPRDAEKPMVESNWALDGVDIAAPSSEIWSTFPLAKSAYGGYERIPGTSMATAFVSGAAALVLSAPGHHADIPEEVRRFLLDHGRPVEALQGLCRSGKTLSVGALAEEEKAK